MVTWIGLLLYEICSLAPNGHVVVSTCLLYQTIVPIQIRRLVDQLRRWLCDGLCTPRFLRTCSQSITCVSILKKCFGLQGISQCLIVMRVALTNEMTKSTPKVVSGNTFSSNSQPSAYTADSKTVTFGTDSDSSAVKPYGYGFAANYVVPDTPESHPMSIMPHV